ncbi:MAG TPA: GGDEF domain-containing protein [Burkholderiales bacterium]|nr:GGDEF domain-containing protein [Burkholderiales bacterium]
MNYKAPAALKPAFVPVAILAVAALSFLLGPSLPPSLAGLKEAGAYFVLLAGAGVSLWFNRGRAFVATVSLLIAYAGYRYALDFGAASFAGRAVYTAIVVLVPLNVLVALLLPERGVSYHGDYRWLFIVAGEILLVAWIASSGRNALSGAAWQEILEHWLLRSPPAPFLGRVLFCTAFTAAVWRAWSPHFHKKEGPVSPIAAGQAGALVAFFIACEWAASGAAFGVFTAAAGAILLVAMLQESHRLAFNDELTGLPGRRALQEAMASLGPRYVLAMGDVDHFKSFNDTHGHDIGDQVLKLVAARLAEVGGGGRAFRYGGEEFTVLFDGATLAEALPHLEAIRASVEAYRMAVRGEGRPKEKEKGEKLRAPDSQPPDKMLSVTISIGAAEPAAEAGTPALVLKAADEALYRAKRGGRNRVSR